MAVGSRANATVRRIAAGVRQGPAGASPAGATRRNPPDADIRKRCGPRTILKSCTFKRAYGARGAARALRIVRQKTDLGGGRLCLCVASSLWTKARSVAAAISVSGPIITNGLDRIQAFGGWPQKSRSNHFGSFRPFELRLRRSMARSCIEMQHFDGWSTCGRS